MSHAINRGMTLGERLQQQARRLMIRREPLLPWHSLVEETVARNEQRVGRSVARWQRVESDESHIAPHASSIRSSIDLADGFDAYGVPLGSPELEKMHRLIEYRDVGVRLHEGPAAQLVTQAQHADAVTIGTHIFLGERAGTTESQRAPLLAHELTHVQRGLDPHAAWHRMTGPGIQREERTALQHERLASRSPLVPAPAPHTSQAPPVPTVTHPIATSAASPIVRPMSAGIGRDLSSGNEAGSAPSPATAGGSGSHERLMQELLLRVRTDFERGG